MLWPEGRSDQERAELNQNWLVTGLNKNESNPNSPNTRRSDQRSSGHDVTEDLMRSGLFTEVLQVRNSDNQRHLLSDNSAESQVRLLQNADASRGLMTSQVRTQNISTGQIVLPNSESSHSTKNFEFAKQSPVTVRNANEVLMNKKQTSPIQRSSLVSGIKPTIQKTRRKKYKRYKGVNLEVDPKQYTLKTLWELKDSDRK